MRQLHISSPYPHPAGLGSRSATAQTERLFRRRSNWVGRSATQSPNPEASCSPVNTARRLPVTLEGAAADARPGHPPGRGPAGSHQPSVSSSSLPPPSAMSMPSKPPKEPKEPSAPSPPTALGPARACAVDQEGGAARSREASRRQCEGSRRQPHQAGEWCAERGVCVRACACACVRVRVRVRVRVCVCVWVSTRVRT